MDSKQLALVYLMEEANRMASVCTKAIHALDKNKSVKEIEKQFGILFSAMKEVGEEFKLDEYKIQEYAENEYVKRQSVR